LPLDLIGYYLYGGDHNYFLRLRLIINYN